MTEVECRVFCDRVTELALARGKKLEDGHVMGLFALLRDLAWSDVARGLEHSARYDRWFPDPVRIREAVAHAQAHASAAIAPEVAAALANGEIWCVDCDDTGWRISERESRACPGETRTYASPCPCRTRNPHYQAKRAQTPRMAGDGGEE